MSSAGVCCIHFVALGLFGILLLPLLWLMRLNLDPCLDPFSAAAAAAANCCSSLNSSQGLVGMYDNSPNHRGRFLTIDVDFSGLNVDRDACSISNIP